MVISISQIIKFALILVALFVVGYIFVVGFNGNSEEHGVTSEKSSKKESKKASGASTSTASETTEKKG